MLSLGDVMSQSGFTEEEVFDWGLSGEICFLVVVPELGACHVPDRALSHFMAGADFFDASGMPEHYSGALSGSWRIKYDRLRISADSWERFTQRVHELYHVATKQCGRISTMSKAGFEAEEADRAKRHAAGHFTMLEAAEVMAAAYGLDAEDFLKSRMLPAFAVGALALIDPKDGGPVTGRRCRDFHDWVTSANMDKWLEAAGYPYRWPKVQQKARALAEVVPDSEIVHWKMRVQAEAAKRWVTLRKSGANPTVSSLCPLIAKWCKENDVLTDSKINPTAGYLRTHVLGGTHWTPPT